VKGKRRERQRERVKPQPKRSRQPKKRGETDDANEPGMREKRSTQEENELLVEWFVQDPVNAELDRTKPVATSKNIAGEVFEGLRTGNANTAQWDLMKANR
jgi:hypothetical protein